MYRLKRQKYLEKEKKCEMVNSLQLISSTELMGKETWAVILMVK